MSAIRTIGAKVHDVSTDTSQDCDARVLSRHTDRASLGRPMPPPALATPHNSIVREALALIAPPACPACRAPLAAARLVLCPGCAARLPWLPRRCCPRCALPSHGGRRCPAATASFGRAWAPLAYDGVARDLVAALKFRGALPLAGVLAAHVAANLPADLRPRAGRRQGVAPADLAAPDLAAPDL